MAGRHPEPVRITADAQDAVARLEAAVTSAESILVHEEGVVLSDGTVERMLRTLHEPHRRLVRVHNGAGSCYLARSELLATALDRGVPAAMILADPPGLDREIAHAADTVPLDGPTPVEDPASGRWRVWLDGAVIGVGTAGTAGAQTTRAARALALARRRAGRVRRELVRLRQRPQR